MNRRSRSAAAAVFVVLSLLCFACGGGHGGGGGPTAPPPPSGKRLQLTVFAVPGNFEGGVLEGALSFDGREVGRTDWSRAGGPCSFNCGITVDMQGIAAGNHTVRFTVVRQERATTLYNFILNGFITDPTTGVRSQITDELERLRLRGGESVTFTVRI